MYDFAVFDCTAILPREKVAQFKDLFYHKGKDKGEKNFGVIANWTEEELSDNRVEITFDCQNGRGFISGGIRQKSTARTWKNTAILYGLKDCLRLMIGRCRKLKMSIGSICKAMV